MSDSPDLILAAVDREYPRCYRLLARPGEFGDFDVRAQWWPSSLVSVTLDPATDYLAAPSSRLVSRPVQNIAQGSGELLWHVHEGAMMAGKCH